MTKVEKKTLGVRMPQTTANLVQAYAAAQGVSQSQLVVMAVNEYLMKRNVDVGQAALPLFIEQR